MSRSISIRLAWLLSVVAPASLVAQDDYPDVVLADGPVAYYRFEETEGTLADSSGNGLDSVSLTNVVLGQAGQVGNAVSFPGNASVEVAATLNMADPKGEGPGDFSLECLANAAVILPANSILAQINGTGLGRTNLLLTSPTGAFGTFIGGTTTASSVIPQIGSWYHVLLTYDAAVDQNTMRVYVNGVLVGTRTDETAESATGNWVIGAHKNRNMQFFNGLLDEVALYDYRLDDPDGDDDTTDSRVVAHFEAAFPTGAPCVSLELSCEATVDGVSASIAPMPGDCDCSSLEVFIDDVSVGTVEPAADGSFSVPLPDPCEPDSEHILKVTCLSDGRSETCAFLCPIDPCDVLELTAPPTVVDGPNNKVVRLEIVLPPLTCGYTDLEITIDGQAVDSVAIPGDGVLEVPLLDPCDPGTRHSISTTIVPGGPSVMGYFRCPGSYAETILADAPVAYYAFDESAGAETVADSSGNGLDGGDLVNTTLGACGILGKAVEFAGDGTLQLGIQMNPADSEGDGVGVGLDDYSIELFTKTTISANEQIMLAQEDGGGLGRSHVLVTANGFLGTFIGGGTTDSTVTPVVDQWHHVIMTYDGSGTGNLRFYIDGEPAGVGSRTAEPATGSYILGGHKLRDRQFFTGRLDELSFYNYRLDDPDGDNDTSDSMVGEHYAARLFPSGSPGTVEVTCGVTEDDRVSVSWTLSPEVCDCAVVDILVDDVVVDTVDASLGSTLVDLPEECTPESEHAVAVACVGSGTSGTCTFVCPISACDTVEVTCEVTEEEKVSVTWTLSPEGCDCATVDVLRDDVVVGTVDAALGSTLIDLPVDCVPESEHTVAVTCTESAASGSCTFQCPLPPKPQFLRGDTNADAVVDLSDGVFVFNFLFLGGREPPCLDAADVNDDQAVDISDGISVLNYLYLGDDPPPAPGPQVCGTDPSDDELGCLEFLPCVAQ